MRWQRYRTRRSLIQCIQIQQKIPDWVAQPSTRREADKNNVLLTSPGFDLNLLSALRAQNLETEAKGQR